MSTYALIHGAYGSGSVWEPFAAELERRGHRVVAPDLPIEDSRAQFSDYADVVESALDGRDDDVVVVGHSLGGVTAALVAARAPGRRVAYVAAVLPEPLRPLAHLLRHEPVILPGFSAAERRTGDRRVRLDPAAAGGVLFSDVDAPTAQAQTAALRPQALAPFFEVCPLDALPPGPCIVCREDQVVSPEWGREAARRLLHASALELDGGHFPQLTRPAELAEVLEA